MARHKTSRPWFAAGGMQVNMAGMGLNTFIPVIFLVSHLAKEELRIFLTGLCCCYASALIVGCRSVYCILVVPTYMTSLLLCFQLNISIWTVVLGVALAIVKVNICMSVCLHRYAAHAAFKCGPITNIVMNVIGCLANQGGPIWWASQHRCHHKYCDLPRDPHSPIVSGTEAAFSFFEIHQAVEEEFAPRHLESFSLRLLDTWSWFIVAMELMLSQHFLGPEGLFVAYTSTWICQSITLWFNIANHPPENPKKCKASDGKAALSSYYLPFHILDALYPLFAFFVAEGEHQHHHDNAGLAKRKPNDVAYWTFIAPLEQLGLGIFCM